MDTLKKCVIIPGYTRLFFVCDSIKRHPWPGFGWQAICGEWKYQLRGIMS